MTTTTPGTPNSALSSAQWRQFVWITLAAVSLYVFFRFLPTGTDLNHMDFRVTGKNAIEMCDPSNPQFISVIAATSPVALTLKTAAAPTAGREVQVTLRMTTANNKLIAPEDLVVMHTRKLHLLIADPSLTDYQHLHPEPTRVPGEWSFTFTPKLGGIYRIFADFTPAATNRSLYANVDLVVAGEQLTTTGHAWDEDLQEWNNPLPMWWTYLFYITVVFGLIFLRRLQYSKVECALQKLQ